MHLKHKSLMSCSKRNNPYMTAEYKSEMDCKPKAIKKTNRHYIIITSGRMVTFMTFSQFSIYLLMYLGFPVMPDHPVLETRKYLLHTVFRSIMWLFPLFCSATGLSLSSAMAGLWSCFGVTTLGVPGARMKSFLSTSSEKPCSWAALTVAIFIIIYWSCGLHYVIFFFAGR